MTLALVANLQTFETQTLFHLATRRSIIPVVVGRRTIRIQAARTGIRQLPVMTGVELRLSSSALIAFAVGRRRVIA